MMAQAADSSKRYNILSLDAAKYKGYMTANFISYMEQKAYQIAQRDLCFPDRDEGRIAMHELFDFIAGSETGGIIASTLVIPNDDESSLQKNKYFATKSLKFFEDNVDKIWVDQKVPVTTRLLIIGIIISLICGGVFYLTNNYFKYEGFEDRVEQLQRAIPWRVPY